MPVAVKVSEGWGEKPVRVKVTSEVFIPPMASGAKVMVITSPALAAEPLVALLDSIVTY